MDRESIGERIGDMFNTHLFKDKTKVQILSDKIKRRENRLKELNKKKDEKNKQRETIQQLALDKLQKKVDGDDSLKSLFNLLKPQTL